MWHRSAPVSGADSTAVADGPKVSHHLRMLIVAAVGLSAIVAAVALTTWVNTTATSYDQLANGLTLLGVTAVSVVIVRGHQALQRTTRHLAAARQTLAGVVESSDDAIVAKTLDGTITAWNTGAERMFGYRADQAIGNNIAMVTLPAEIANLPDIFARVGRGELVDHYETQRIRGDGTVLDVWVSISPLRDANGAVVGASAITRDITEHKQAEAARRVLAAVVESSDDSIVAKALDGTITAWNPGAERMYGYSADEAVGNNIAMIILPDNRTDLTDILTRVGRGEQIEHFETQRIRKDGTVLDISVSISPIRDDSGAVVGASAITHDITARKRAEADMRDLEERSQQAQRLQSLGQLAGGIAHDFNNLLAIILNYSDFIAEETADDSPVHGDAMTIRSAAERATALARQLLVFARGEPMTTEIFDLNVAIADAQNLLTRTIGAHINLITRPSPSAVMISADRGQIHQVLLNLVFNARDAMPDGGTLVIEATTAEIDDGTTHLQPPLAPGVYARLLVSDTGIGMTAEVAQHILEPFYTTKPKGHGTGLGLATVYGIVTQAGGGLNIYSEPNLGTTMRIYLPTVDNAVRIPHEKDTERPATGHGQTILVVEDEDAIRQVVARILGSNGYVVLTAGLGSEAMALLADHRCDLLLTDVVMPEMSGRHLAERAQKRYPDLPVLYMSGYSDGLLTDQRLLEAGSELLQKPFTAPELLRKVHNSMTHGQTSAHVHSTP